MLKTRGARDLMFQQFVLPFAPGLLSPILPTLSAFRTFAGTLGLL
jgi:hypothetical protein